MLCLISLTIFYRVKVNKQNTFNYQLSIINYQLTSQSPQSPQFPQSPQNHLPALPLSSLWTANAIQGEARLPFRAVRPNAIITRTYQPSQSPALPNRPLRPSATSPKTGEEFFKGIKGIKGIKGY